MKPTLGRLEPHSKARFAEKTTAFSERRRASPVEGMLSNNSSPYLRNSAPAHVGLVL